MPLDTAERTLLLTPSATLAIYARAKSMRAEGLDVVGFGAGEPDFDTPEHIKAAAMGSLDAGFTKYTPSSGIPELRAAISEKLKAENNLSYEPSQIIVSCGAKHACFNAILATVNPGDEVLIPSPYWLSYPEMVRIAGGEPVMVPTKAENSYKLTPELFREYMSPMTKMVIINSPVILPARSTPKTNSRLWPKWPSKRKFSSCRTKSTRSSSMMMPNTPPSDPLAKTFII